MTRSPPDNAPQRTRRRSLRSLVLAAELESLGRTVMPDLRFSVFGLIVAVERDATGWLPYLLGPDGKRRRAEFEVPEFIAEDELCQYLADLFHESASAAHPDVFQLK